MKARADGLLCRGTGGVSNRLSLQLSDSSGEEDSADLKSAQRGKFRRCLEPLGQWERVHWSAAPHGEGSWSLSRLWVLIQQWFQVLIRSSLLRRAHPHVCFQRQWLGAGLWPSLVLLLCGTLVGGREEGRQGSWAPRPWRSGIKLLGGLVPVSLGGPGGGSSASTFLTPALLPLSDKGLRGGACGLKSGTQAVSQLWRWANAVRWKVKFDYVPTDTTPRDRW